jgi:hypothetical protein
MTYIDLGLLNLVERGCRTFQRLTGRTNIWLGVQLTNLSIVVFFAWAAMYSWVTPHWTEQIMVAVFCAVLLYLLTQTVFKEPIEAHETNAYRRVAKGLRNPRRIRDAPLRISFLTLSVVLSYPILFLYASLRLHVVLFDDLIPDERLRTLDIPNVVLELLPMSYVLIVLTTVVLYLLACDPLPPCAGTLKHWVRRWAPAKADPATDPVGQRRSAA